MLTAAEFAEQQRSLGRRIHEHEGVYWEQRAPQYCRPAFEFEVLAPGAARPKRSRSLLGYSHLTCATNEAMDRKPLMILDGTNFANFGLSTLGSRKRNYVRRAMEAIAVHRIAELESYLERVRAINLSQAMRHELGAGSTTPPSRYTHEADAWRRQVRRVFALAERPWWGAFHNGVLVAYMRTIQVDDTTVIQQVKADTENLNLHPVDALYFEIISRITEGANCARVINGAPRNASLDHFKKQFGFEPRSVPEFARLPLPVRLLRERKRARARTPAGRANR